MRQPVEVVAIPIGLSVVVETVTPTGVGRIAPVVTLGLRPKRVVPVVAVLFMA